MEVPTEGACISKTWMPDDLLTSATSLASTLELSAPMVISFVSVLSPVLKLWFSGGVECEGGVLGQEGVVR